ncbi:histidine kinase [Oharaeibacter diazotrophicus]|uniref:Uncharacterized protein n=1 Tax=Oharaeibacter diazotrophicus TaxID=1920512 RepID=A0A4R6RCT3_9HYPH|nr:histidine kinase [Oharaeibacter diazotrophicus]TDP84021.1 hypothetical protein EDD54_2624 [Oharaeibacter diazotrophicus]BBE73060.1 hypothetical protein OHA_1_02666 [Pleomorphomonas sp. SM30]GLS74848.1 hypothetical protein GCM10007904_01830 [Oharaeibacter diazotrophicus]
MPTLSRFARTVVIAVALVVGAMMALANLVAPRTRTITEPIDSRIIRDAGKPAPSDR